MMRGTRPGELTRFLVHHLAAAAPLVLLGCADNPTRTTSDSQSGRAVSKAVESDVNGDGHADLVSVEDGTVYVWLGRSDGSFTSAVKSFRGSLDIANVDGSGIFIIGLGDVTGDGKSDLIGVHTSGSVIVWPGNEFGQFDHAIASFNGTYDLANIDGVGHYVLGVADINGDGRADLVSHNSDTNDIYVYEGQADGTFTPPTASFNGTFDLAQRDGTGHYVLGLADVDGDGRADLVTHHAGTNDVYAFPGRADGSFGQGVASFAGKFDLASLDGPGHNVIAVADATGDGRADLVTYDSSDELVRVYPGLSNATFGPAVSSIKLPLANREGTARTLIGVLDVTGDGIGDLVLLGADRDAHVWRGHETGRFAVERSSFHGTLDVANKNGIGHYIISPFLTR